MAGGRTGLAPAAGCQPGGWRGAAIVAVKLVHSLLFFGIAASIAHIFYAGIANRRSRWTDVEVLLAVGESAIFTANRFRCPLRQVAESLGAESGQVTDIFLPRAIANRIPWIFTPLLAIGLVGLGWHRWNPSRCRIPT